MVQLSVPTVRVLGIGGYQTDSIYFENFFIVRRWNMEQQQY